MSELGLHSRQEGQCLDSHRHGIAGMLKVPQLNLNLVAGETTGKEFEWDCIDNKQPEEVSSQVIT